MAFKLTEVNSYGTGALGDITNPSGQINSYANVTALGNGTITIGTPANGVYEKFEVGKEILIHVSARSSGADAQYLGKSAVATIMAVNGSVLSLSKDISGLPPSALPGLVPSADFANHHVQAMTVAQFNTLTLSAGSISPLTYNITNKCGGILAIKCKTGITFSGGSINLVDKGIPVANVSLRPLTAQETEMTTTGKTTGWENHITSRQFLLNAGDGAAWIVAKASTITSTNSRIGSTAAGSAYYPYAAVDNSPAEVKGGSTILLVSDAITGFTPAIISKGKNAGAGYGRCYIATETALLNDEGLYAQDCISNPARLKTLGIKDFGTGVLGNVTNPTGQINSHASISTMSADGKTVAIVNVSNGAYEQFVTGTKVVFHITASKAGAAPLLGKFFATEILAVNSMAVTLKDAIPFLTATADYYCQLITIPQFDTLNINNATYSGGLSWSQSNKLGGLLVLCAKSRIDISDGIINMWSKGIYADTTFRPFLPTQCSGQQKDYLPVSQGGGAVLIITKKLAGNGASRLGFNGNGANFGGNGTTTGYANGGVGYAVGGGFNGACGSITGGVYTSGGYGGIGGRGYNGVTGIDAGGNLGMGYGGTSLFIVADSIDFNLAMICTGGIAGGGGHGGAGYGGGGCMIGSYIGSGASSGGGYGGGGGGFGTGGGGGGSGTCFIYANIITSADYTGAVA